MKRNNNKNGRTPAVLSHYVALSIGLTLPAFTGVGCAHSNAPQVTQQSVDRVQQRIEEVERTNARLTVRVEELENQVMLLQDSLAASRMSYQRNLALAQSPQYNANQDSRPMPPAPETHYSYGATYGQQTLEQRAANRKVGHIELSPQQSGRDQLPPTSHRIEAASPRHNRVDGDESEEDELIITEETYRQYFGEPPVTSEPAKPKPDPTSNAGQGSAHPPVTDERLPTSRELKEKREQKVDDEKAPEKLTRAQSQKLYQESLAHYFNGNYHDGLYGFKAFLAADPREDYIDNALYWIGECHYGLEDYDTSVQYFQRIMRELPEAGKVPDAMLKMALAYERMGQLDDAETLLRQLVREHSSTDPGKLGAQRLTEFYGPQ